MATLPTSTKTLMAMDIRNIVHSNSKVMLLLHQAILMTADAKIAQLRVGTRTPKIINRTPLHWTISLELALWLFYVPQFLAL
jgi:hypothetical protein